MFELLFLIILFLIVLAFLGENKGAVSLVWLGLVKRVSMFLRGCVWLKDWCIIIFGLLLLKILDKNENEKK